MTSFYTKRLSGKLSYFKVLCNWHFAFAYYRLVEMPYFVGTKGHVFASHLQPCVVQVSFGRLKQRPLCVCLGLWSHKVQVFCQPPVLNRIYDKIAIPKIVWCFVSCYLQKNDDKYKKVVYMVMQLKEYSCSRNPRHVELFDGQSAILIEGEKNHKLGFLLYTNLNHTMFN